MKCEYCGENNLEGSKFCKKCGATLEDKTAKQAVDVDKVKEGVKKAGSELTKTISNIPKKFLAIGGACVAFIIVLIILVSAFQSGPYIKPKSQTTFFYSFSDEQSIAMVNDDLLKTKIDGTIYVTQTDLKGTTTVVLSSEDTLYLITSKKVEKIADDVNEFVLSSDGNGVAYTDNEGTLKLYNGKTSAWIADDVYSREMAISPDGKSVIYLLQGEDSDESVLFLFNGKKSTLIGEGLYPVAVSNKGKYIYSYSEDGDGLYVSSPKGDKNKISANVDTGSGKFILNSDNTEICFYVEGRTYISVKGKEKQKLGNSSLTPVLPGNSLIIDNGHTGAMIYSVDSLLDKIYLSDGYDLYFINTKRESEKLVGNVNFVSVTEDAKEMVYSRYDSLYRVSVKDTTNPKELASDVRSYVTSPDGKQVYYINYDDELWSVKGNSKSRKIADDVMTVSITNDNNALFLSDYNFEIGGILYSSTGKKKKKVEDDVAMTLGGLNHVGYLVKNDEGYDLYVSSGNLKFKLAAEDVSVNYGMQRKTWTAEEYLSQLFYFQ